jgi:hypothetical protein
MAMGKNRIEELRKPIEELKKRWPAHSVPAAMMEQLDELEEQLKLELERRARSDNDLEADA